MEKETITIGPKQSYYIHNVFAGSNKLHIDFNNNNVLIGSPKFYGKKSNYYRLTKIQTQNTNTNLNIGGIRFKLDKETNCSILLQELKYHDVVLENLNDFEVNYDIEYNNIQEQTPNGFVGYVRDKKLIHLEGMVGLTEL